MQITKSRSTSLASPNQLSSLFHAPHPNLVPAPPPRPTLTHFSSPSASQIAPASDCILTYCFPHQSEPISTTFDPATIVTLSSIISRRSFCSKDSSAWKTRQKKIWREEAHVADLAGIYVISIRNDCVTQCVIRPGNRARRDGRKWGKWSEEAARFSGS